MKNLVVYALFVHPLNDRYVNGFSFIEMELFTHLLSEEVHGSTASRHVLVVEHVY